MWGVQISQAQAQWIRRLAGHVDHGIGHHAETDAAPRDTRHREADARVKRSRVEGQGTNGT